MGIKSIAIIGGGITGLSALHFCKQRFGGKASVTLYERSAQTGGCIQTVLREGFCFEAGPNGFLANAATLGLVKDLGLGKQLIRAKAANKRRYIQAEGRLHELPIGLLSFFKTGLLSFDEKLDFVYGFLRRPGKLNKSIYEYASARYGRAVAERLFDPFVSGIFAGNIKRLHMASVFPRNKNSYKGPMYSLKYGMGQMVSALADLYAADIKTGSGVDSLQEIKADHIICAVPAYAAQSLFNDSRFELSQSLARIPYAPVAVVGLGFESWVFKKKPEGFGYLVTSSERKEVLGVLLESQVFEGRAPQNMVALRVFMGGVNNPEVVNDEAPALVAAAVRELDHIYGLKKRPLTHWVKTWPLAIPQYEMEYPWIVSQIKAQAGQMPNVTLAGSYLGGVSLNDCVNNAKAIAYSLAV